MGHSSNDLAVRTQTFSVFFLIITCVCCVFEKVIFYSHFELLNINNKIGNIMFKVSQEIYLNSSDSVNHTNTYGTYHKISDDDNGNNTNLPQHSAKIVNFYSITIPFKSL